MVGRGTRVPRKLRDAQEQSPFRGPPGVLAPSGIGGEQRTETCQTDVDAEGGAAANLKEDSQRGQEDGEDDLADVAVRRRALLARVPMHGRDL